MRVGQMKTPCTTWKDKGKLTAGGMEMAYTGDWAVQLPEKYRFSVKVKFGDMDLDFTHVTSGDKVLRFGRRNDARGER